VDVASDLLVLDGESAGEHADGLSLLVEATKKARAGSVAWQCVRLPDHVGTDELAGAPPAGLRAVSVADVKTGQRLRRLYPDVEMQVLPDVGLLARRLSGVSSTDHDTSVSSKSRPAVSALVQPDLRDVVEGAVGARHRVAVVAINDGGPEDLVASVQDADIVIGSDPRLVAVAYSLGRPLIALALGGDDDRLQTTFGGGVGPALEIEDLRSAVDNLIPPVDRTLLPAYESELDHHFDRLATIATEEAWRRRRAAEIADHGAAKMTDAAARDFTEELTAHGHMARRVVEERHQVVVRDRELAAERDRLAGLEPRLQEALNELTELRQTRTFRYTARLRAAYLTILKLLRRR
jgi:hypothetical protein